jgi:hypothetical protein
MQDYFSTWAINRLIGLFNFDKGGNFLPDAYSAPDDYLKMLYPIDDLMNYDKQGTLVIDREQYTPELRRLSFFIYIVDEELFEQYKAAQNFNGPTTPTFMFNKHANDGLRIFKDYYALARHLRKQRYVTYILGKRTTFYLRYFLYQIHVHTIDEQYVYGTKQDGSLANSVVESIKRHLAFNHSEKLTYDADVTVDNYKTFRALLKSGQFKISLPDIKEFHSKTEIARYQKQTLNCCKVYTLKKNKVKSYADMGIYDYHNCIVVNDKVIFFIWDTRDITEILDAADVDMEDFKMVEFDNRNDLVCKANASSEIRRLCEELRFSAPIQMRDNNE